MFAPSLLVGASHELVTLVGASLSELVTDPAEAQVGYALAINGEEQVKVDKASNFITIGIWLLSGDPSDYQAQFIAPGGDPTSPDPINTPVEMDTNPQWGLFQSGIGSQQTVGNIEIIWKPTGKRIAEAPLSMIVNVDP